MACNSQPCRDWRIINYEGCSSADRHQSSSRMSPPHHRCVTSGYNFGYSLFAFTCGPILTIGASIMSVVQDVEKSLREYHERFRNPRLEIPTPSPLYFLAKQESGDSSSENTWPARWPNAEKPGVYVLLDADGHLLYIGKADNLGVRLSSYFHHGPNKTCRIKHDWGPKPPCSLFTVPVAETFEAYSLEQYLIEQLNPPINRLGKRL